MVNWWRASADMTRLWRMSMETWSAAAYVVGQRSTMMGNAALYPASLDMRELGRMVPEKFDAFSRGMASAASGRDPIDAATRALAPVHKSVTANARRLKRK